VDHAGLSQQLEPLKAWPSLKQVTSSHTLSNNSLIAHRAMEIWVVAVDLWIGPLVMYVIMVSLQRMPILTLDMMEHAKLSNLL